MGGLCLNFFECNLTNQRAEIKYLDYGCYSTREKFNELKSTNKQYYFYRDYDNRIYYWPIFSNTSDDTLNGIPVEISISEKPEIFAKMIETCIVFNIFKPNNNVKAFKNKHSNTWEIITINDLLNSKIPGLCLYRVINLNTFHSVNSNNEPLLGICISAGVKNTFLWNRDEFGKNNIAHSDLNGNDKIIYANKKSLNRFLTSTGFSELYERTLSLKATKEQEFITIQKSVEYINKHRTSIVLPTGLILEPLKIKNIPYENERMAYEKIVPPKLFLYNEMLGSGRIEDRLRKLKPCSYEVFQTKKLIIGIICPREYEGSLEPFILQIKGILKESFHVPYIEFAFARTSDTKVNSYRECIYAEEINNADLVIVVVNEEHKLIVKGKDSPYYYCKAKLLGRGIPTQEVQIKNIRKFNIYILNNIALNIYAKLGGTPWLIEKEEKIKYELIIGIGSTLNKSGNPILGIAQIFDSNGRYIVGDCVPLSTYEDYTEKLECYLTNSIQDILNSSAIEKNSEFRIIFNIFKSPSYKYEIKAITNTLRKFHEYSFNYCLAHLGYGHNFRLFNDGGKGQNEKGTFIPLNNNISLLHFTAESTIPLQVVIDKRSVISEDMEFSDLYYVSKQIFWFSFLSYKSMMPSKKPVTLTYPTLMARITEQLKEIDGWDYDYLEKMGDKLWFI